ncbi:hypothetical protein ACHWQZ_G008193 [Mnemiopsis leidyi]
MDFLLCGCGGRGSKKKKGKSGQFYGVENDRNTSVDGNKIYVNLLPLWKGQKKQGVRYSSAILNAMAHDACDSDNIVTKHYKDEFLNNIEGASEEEYTSHMNKLCKKLSTNLSDLKSGDTVLNFGGDHSISMATVQKMYHIYPDLRVIWIDAHADINSPQTTESGNFHGMPVYYISDLSDVHKNSCQISLENIAYVGVRDVDVEEIKILKDHNIKNYTKDEIIRRGSSTIISELIEEKELLKHPVHISFDIDAVDPKECPSTGTTAADGISIAHVVKLINRIKKTGNLVSMDIVEFNPLIGDDKDVEKTVQSIMKVMREIVR